MSTTPTTPCTHTHTHTRTVRSVMDRPSFFADRLYRFMKGAGTDDDDLVRVVVARCEVDMVQIKEAFPKLYNNQGKSLASFIKVCVCKEGWINVHE